MFDQFFDTLKECRDATAFVFFSNGKAITKTYGQFFEDVLKASSLIKSKGLKKGDKVLLLIKPSYLFYVFVFASINCKLNLVLSQLTRTSLRHAIALSGVKYVATSGVTRIVKKLLPLGKMTEINMDSYQRFAADKVDFCIDASVPLMTVFSGGGTGTPKPVERSALDLDAQLKLIGSSIEDFFGGEISLTLMPNYVLAMLSIGATNVLFSKGIKGRNKRRLASIVAEQNVSAMVASVSKFAALNTPLTTIKKAYTGGSPMSLAQLERIKSNLPNASFSYIYGCTEVPIVAKTTLDEYEEGLRAGRLCVGKIMHSSSVIIVEPDHRGVGKIHVCPNNSTFSYVDKAKNLLSVDGKQYFCTGDFGYIENDRLYLSGRQGFSKTAWPSVFNYEKELLMTNNYGLQSCVYIFYCGTEYLLVQNATKQQLSSIKADHPSLHLKNTRKIPLEKRHNSKPDLEKCLKLLGHNKRRV